VVLPERQAVSVEIRLPKALVRAGAVMPGAGGEMETTGQYPITLVTAYFELEGRPQFSKPENPYPGWIRNFLPYIRWPLVVFCGEQSVEMLKEARGDKPAVWHVTRPQEFYVYKYLDDLKRLSFPEGQAEAYIARSLIWHEKHHFVQQVLSENPFGSEMIFWCDVGVFRRDQAAPWWQVSPRRICLFEDIEWPNLEVCRALPQDKVILAGRSRDDKKQPYGGWFGGAVEPLRQWCEAYYRRLEKRKRNGAFTHIDEFVMLSCWKRRRQLVHLISAHSIPYIAFMPRQKSKEIHFMLYFLSGKRFPWKYFCRRCLPGWRNDARR